MPMKKPRRAVARRQGFAFRILAASVLAAGLSGRLAAQEIPRPSYARMVQQTALPTVANFRVGEVLLRVDAGTSFAFTDNVDLSQHGKPDLIITPTAGLSATWAVTKLNTLQFRLGFGYAFYLNNPILNRQTTTISPDSAVSFNVYAGDVKINFHDQFSLQQDTVGEGSISGVATLQRFTNTAGFSVLWDTNDIVWNLGYDHYNFITLGGANSSSGSTAASLSRLDHSTDQISASMAAKINTALIGGVEGTASYSNYPDEPASNFSSVSVGPYFEFQLTKYTHVFLSGGFKGFYSGANAAGSVSVSSTTPAQPSQGNPAGYYANLSFVHRLNKYYSDHLDIGRSDDVDALNGHAQTQFVRYNGMWQVSRKITLSSGLFYENVHILAGSALGGTRPSDYWRFGGSLNTAYEISQHFGLTLAYNYVLKEALIATQSYGQNRVTFSLGYRF
jgi:hypothetical protein